MLSAKIEIWRDGLLMSRDHVALTPGHAQIQVGGRDYEIVDGNSVMTGYRFEADVRTQNHQTRDLPYIAGYSKK